LGISTFITHEGIGAGPLAAAVEQRPLVDGRIGITSTIANGPGERIRDDPSHVASECLPAMSIPVPAHCY
jgi:hypothetical protein